MNLSGLNIKDIGKGLRNGDFSSREITRSYLDRIEEKDGDIGAYLRTMPEMAMVQAEEADRLIAAHKEIGPLAGVPLAIKDNMLIAGEKATAASRILENYVAAYDAGVIKKLKEARAVFLGKTNLDEFAMGSSTENSALKLTRNPRDLTRVPGGSSGGSAAAVAADLAAGALGSDTFSSVRLPASYCGVVGLKCTYGSVSRAGLIAMASSMDQIGPLAKTVEDAAVLFQAIAGRDEMDATSTDADYGDLLDADPSRMVIGMPEEYFIEGVDPEVRVAIESVRDVFSEAGAKILRVSLPHTKYAVPCYYLSMPAEVSANLARFDGIRFPGVFAPGELPKELFDIYSETRGRGFGPEVKRRIILGTFVLSSGYYDAYYKKAQQVRRLVSDDFTEAFKKVDVLLTPVAPTPAFKIGEKADDPLAMYLSDIFTGPTNLAGLPGISVPVAGREGKLPIGFQLIGKHFREADILGLGRFYEKTTAP